MKGNVNPETVETELTTTQVRRRDEIEKLKLEETHRQNAFRRQVWQHILNTATTALIMYFFGPSAGGGG